MGEPVTGLRTAHGPTRPATDTVATMSTRTEATSTDATHTDPTSTDPSRTGPTRTDLVALIVALAIIAVSAVVGVWLDSHGYDLVLPAPPLLAFWHPHVGWGTPLAVITVMIALQVQRVAPGLGWSRLVVAGWLVNLGWLMALTQIDGLRRGWANVLLDPNEYLADLPRITDVGAFLRTFSEHIRYGSEPAQAWTTHVAGHPPLATLMFVALDRIGLPGGFWAGALCILVGSAAGTALVVLVRELAGEGPARRLVPLAAVFPGAVWIGVSADGLFAGVALSGLALMAVAAGPGRNAVVRVLLGLAGGLLLGATVYLSYGLALLGLVALFVMIITVRRAGPAALVAWGAGLLGAAAVAGIFFATGFNWFTGLAQLKIRYDTSVAHQRPYGYFVWANFGAFLISCSPVLAVAVVRAVSGIKTRGPDAVVGLLCLSGLTAALIADLSGMSKAETERIWLSFGLITFSGLALLRGRAARWALIGSAGTALLVNHLLDTGW